MVEGLKGWNSGKVEYLNTDANYRNKNYFINIKIQITIKVFYY